MNTLDITVSRNYCKFVMPGQQQIEHISKETVKDRAVDVYQQIVQQGTRIFSSLLFVDLYEFISLIIAKKRNVLIDLCECYTDQPQIDYSIVWNRLTLKVMKRKP